MTRWYRYDAVARKLTLTVHVQPNARATQCDGLHGEALRIRVAAPAIENKANGELVLFLRRLLALPAGAVSLRHGAHGRHKVIDIEHVAPDALESITRRLLPTAR